MLWDLAWIALEKQTKPVVHPNTLNTLQASENAGFKLICALQ